MICIQNYILTFIDKRLADFQIFMFPNNRNIKMFHLVTHNKNLIKKLYTEIFAKTYLKTSKKKSGVCYLFYSLK